MKERHRGWSGECEQPLEARDGEEKAFPPRISRKKSNSANTDFSPAKSPRGQVFDLQDYNKSVMF